MKSRLSAFKGLLLNLFAEVLDTHMSTYTQRWAHIQTHAYTHRHTDTHRDMHTYRHAYTQTHRHIHTHTDTQRHSLRVTQIRGTGRQLGLSETHGKVKTVSAALFTHTFVR